MSTKSAAVSLFENQSLRMSEEQAEDFQTQLNNSCTYIAALEEFNTRLCESSDRMGSLILEFLSWFQSLSEIGQKASATFHSDLSATKDSGTPQYVSYCTDSANLVECQVDSIVDDKYTTDQVGESKNLFAWFSDVSKCYTQFNPRFAYASQRPLQQVQRALDRKFSEILLTLAQNVGARPADLAELNIIPVTFPHHSIAYTLLLCRLVDAQQRLSYAEVRDRAQADMIEVRRIFPSPKVLASWPSFRASIDHQNELIRMIATVKGSLREELECLGQEQEQLRDSVDEFAKLSETFKKLCGESGDLFDELVKVNMRRQSLDFVRAHKDIPLGFEIPGMKELVEEESKEECDFEKVSAILKEMQETLSREIEGTREYLERKTTQGPSPQTSFKDLVAQFGRVQEVSDRVIGVMKQADGLASFMRAFPETICSREVIRGQAVVTPAMMNLDGTIQFLKRKIETKQADERTIGLEVCERRSTCDRIAAVGESLKYKAQNQDGICHECEERRVYCLTKCGHTFCERCYNHIKESRVLKCPYPNCDPSRAQFTPEDVIRINWK